jgi:hypothetical protein
MTGSGSKTLSPQRKRRRRSGWRGLIYIAPAMALVIVFFVMPVIFHRLDELAQLAADGRDALDRPQQLRPHVP